MTFGTLTNFFRNYLRFFELLSDMYYLKQTLAGVPRKKLLQKSNNSKGEER